MNVMVFNVPAETVGALSILNEFYNEIKINGDKKNNWTIVLSKPILEETDNIKILRFPWIKKSWLHRWFFDQIIAPVLVKKFRVDKVISFQNIIIPNIKIKQDLYVHNALPFIEYKFKFRENLRFWIYQNIIGKKIFRSIKKANKVIVQTEWMKEACIQKTKKEIEKIEIIQPKINEPINAVFEPNKNSLSTFFYPASEFSYKNHKLIIEACKKLIQNGIDNFKVILTLQGNENGNISSLYKEVKENKLPIEFVGSLARQEVFEYYTRSVLLFPSYIETFGLPLLESKLHKGVILASNCPFSHEILDDYENAQFFDPFNSNSLANLMERSITISAKWNE